MKFDLSKINIKTFYSVGAGLFFCVVLFNIWNLVISWNVWNLPTKLSFIFGSIIFQIMLASLFLYLWKITPDMITDDKSIDKLFEEYDVTR